MHTYKVLVIAVDPPKPGDRSTPCASGCATSSPASCLPDCGARRRTPARTTSTCWNAERSWIGAARPGGRPQWSRRAGVRGRRRSRHRSAGGVDTRETHQVRLRTRNQDGCLCVHILTRVDGDGQPYGRAVQRRGRPVRCRSLGRHGTAGASTACQAPAEPAAPTRSTARTHTSPTPNASNPTAGPKHPTAPPASRSAPVPARV